MASTYNLVISLFSSCATSILFYCHTNTMYILYSYSSSSTVLPFLFFIGSLLLFIFCPFHIFIQNHTCTPHMQTYVHIKSQYHILLKHYILPFSFQFPQIPHFYCLLHPLFCFNFISTNMHAHTYTTQVNKYFAFDKPSVIFYFSFWLLFFTWRTQMLSTSLKVIQFSSYVFEHTSITVQFSFIH